jgi:hypothetical protein
MSKNTAIHEETGPFFVIIRGEPGYEFVDEVIYSQRGEVFDEARKSAESAGDRRFNAYVAEIKLVARFRRAGEDDVKEVPVE